MCSVDYAVRDFYSVLSTAIKKGNNIAHHICQSFSPEETIAPQKALEIGQELMKRMYPDYQYVIATHIDRNHIHNHIIVCAVNFQTHRKLHSNKDSLEKMRSISDEICKENGLSIIEPTNRSHRAILKEIIDKAVENSNNYEEFLDYMQAEKYEFKIGKYLYFRKLGDRNFISTNTLGTAYSEKAIRLKIFGATDVKNLNPNIYSNKNGVTTQRKRLKIHIDNALQKSQSFDEFLKLMKSNDFEIKQGKHLAFKHITGKRFIRCESLGEDYTEYVLKLFFENSQEYHNLKAEIEGKKIGKLIKPQDEFVSRWQANHNINVEIKMLNFLNEYGIESYDELAEKMFNLRNQISKTENNISHLNAMIDEKKDFARAIRTYHQYAPYYKEYTAIKVPVNKQVYKVLNNEKLQKYEYATQILNRYKLSDGSLPKVEDIKVEIEKFENRKTDYEAHNQKLKSELQRYEIVQYNLERLVDEPNEISKSKKENRPISSDDISL
jgi:hypothetical protein